MRRLHSSSYRSECRRLAQPIVRVGPAIRINVKREQVRAHRRNRRRDGRRGRRGRWKQAADVAARATGALCIVGTVVITVGRGPRRVRSARAASELNLWRIWRWNQGRWGWRHCGGAGRRWRRHGRRRPRAKRVDKLAHFHSAAAEGAERHILGILLKRVRPGLRYPIVTNLRRARMGTLESGSCVCMHVSVHVGCGNGCSVTYFEFFSY